MKNKNKIILVTILILTVSLCGCTNREEMTEKRELEIIEFYLENVKIVNDDLIIYTNNSFPILINHFITFDYLLCESLVNKDVILGYYVFIVTDKSNTLIGTWTEFESINELI